MVPVLSLALGWAAAAPPAFDSAQICSAEDKVALSPSAHRRLSTSGPCPSVVPAQTVSDYMKAFAVLSRELADPDNADRLVRTVGARWLWIRTGGEYQVYDAEAKAFVPPASFAKGAGGEPETEEERAAAAAYVEGYQALRGKRYDEALAKLSQCTTLDADHAGCHWELGWVHWVAEDWSAAAASWGEVERVQPDYPELDRWLPKAKAKAGDP